MQDHCEALLRIFHRGKIGESYNVGSNQNINNVDLVKKLLKIVKNNNVILKQIKKERSSKTISPIIKDSPELLRAEKRLLTAINAIIESNDSLKKEFKTKNKKEVRNVERR